MKHTEESKKKLSEARKLWLKNNPDKHVWKRDSKFKSTPCEHLKSFLRKENISFIEEFTPLKERFFSIDIAFPDKMIALEINGNQHYNRDGTLKPYYQERTELLENSGWVVYNIHYYSCFKESMIIPIINTILSSTIKQEFDYLNYIPSAKIDKSCHFCGNSMNKYSKSIVCRSCSYLFKTPKPVKEIKIVLPKEPIYTNCCNCNNLTVNKKFCTYYCFNQFSRKVKVRPSKEELEKLLQEQPITHIAKQYNVSDNTIIKWCKKENIQRPGRGYWEKVYHSVLPEVIETPLEE